MLKFIDSHSHLSFSAYNKDRDKVIERMKKKEVGSIEVGINLKNSNEAVNFASQYDFIWAAVGVHPTEGVDEFDGNAFSQLLKNPKVVAVGECGLDYFHKPFDKKAQEKIFRRQIDLAVEVGKPLILHCRQAHTDALKILAEYKGKIAGTTHFFTGTIEEAQKYLNLGFYIGLDGPITFTDQYDELIKETPLEKILIETDCPYAAPAPYRGGRNEPVYIVEIAKKIATLKDVSVDAIAEVTTKSVKELFKI